MINKTNSTVKFFIEKFDFPNPSWKNLPIGFPSCDISALTPEEKHLYGAIIFAWNMSHPLAYLENILFKTVIISSSMGTALIVLSLSLYYLTINYHLGLTFITDFFA
jgi:hypothetical protein